MRRHHLGSGRRLLLASDWEVTAATVVEKFMLEATVNLRRSGQISRWDEQLGRTVSDPYPPFLSAVKASIKPISGSPTGVVEEQAWILGYRVSVPRSISPSSGQLDEGIIVDVVTCSDPMLVGKSMKVSDITRGTHRFQRDLITSLNS
jgi:hypothetical protein